MRDALSNELDLQIDKAPKIPWRIILAPANFISGVRAVVIVAFAFALLQGVYIPRVVGGFVILFVYWLMDTMDGAVSRWTGTASSFGESVDQTGDRIADFLFCFVVSAQRHDLASVVALYAVFRFSADMAIGRYIGQDTRLYDAAVSLDGKTVSVASRRRHRILLEVNQIFKALFFYCALFNGNTFFLEFWLIGAGLANVIPTGRILIAQAEIVRKGCTH